MFGKLQTWLLDRVGAKALTVVIAILILVPTTLFTTVTEEDVRVYHGAVAKGFMVGPRAGMLYAAPPGASGREVGQRLCRDSHRPITVAELKGGGDPSRISYVNWLGEAVPLARLAGAGLSSLGVEVKLDHRLEFAYFLDERLSDEPLNAACQAEVEAALAKGDVVCAIHRVIHDARDGGTKVFGVIFDHRAIAPVNETQRICPRMTHALFLYEWRSALIVEK